MNVDDSKNFLKRICEISRDELPSYLTPPWPLLWLLILCVEVVVEKDRETEDFVGKKLSVFYLLRIYSMMRLAGHLSFMPTQQACW
jgi:hypothetical protein